MLSCRSSKSAFLSSTHTVGPRRPRTRAVSAMTSQDLLIVGPGVLGSCLGNLWLDRHPGCTVVGQTNSTSNHERLQALGISPRVKEGAPNTKFSFVVFCAPPSGSSDYAAEVRTAAGFWDGSGTLLFTSSAGLFTVEDMSQCNEDSPVVAEGVSERNDRLLHAEKAIFSAGGCVVRLVGLYHARRGAHTHFLKMGKVQRPGSYTVNLIHYEDAASLCVAILDKGASQASFRGRIFVGTDGQPLTFQEMMDYTLASGKFEGKVEFVGEDSPSKGKLMSNCATREAVGWSPRYSSFEEFMARGAEDFYTQTGTITGMSHA